MNRAAFLFLVLIPSILHCSEEKQGLIDLTNKSSIEIPIVHNQHNSMVTKKSKKVATRALFLALVPLAIGAGIDGYNSQFYSTEFRQVATAFPLNATNAQLQQSSCQSYRCFCRQNDSNCICCSEVLFPLDNDAGAEECKSLLFAPENFDYENGNYGVWIKRCKEEEKVTNKIPSMIISLASAVCRVVTTSLAQVIYNCLRK